MNVLGLHAFSHDAGAALVRADGAEFAISEERLSRVKYDGRFPRRALACVLALAGLRGLQDVDLAVCDALGHSGPRVRRSLRGLGYTGDVRVISHHAAHAAAAYFSSPFPEVAVLIVDACGSFADEVPGPRAALALHARSRELQSLYAGRGGRLTLIEKTWSQSGHSVGPGTLYGFGAMMCGFSDLEGGKLMALAALGRRHDLFPDCAFTDFEGHMLGPGDPERDILAPENLDYYAGRYFRGVAPRAPGAPVMQVHGEIARAVQGAAQDAALRMAQRLFRITRCPSLCVAGGFGLNCISNRAYETETPFENVFVQPAATDAGVPLGAALYGRHEIGGAPFHGVRFDPYLGRAYDADEIQAALRDAPGVRVQRPRSIYAAAADLLAAGAIGAWFQGRSEYGPRALGNRSIVADPRHTALRDRLSREIKLRESFRPYAPAVLAHRCAEFFDRAAPSPHMLFLSRALPAARKRIPGVLHSDGTARVQTVSRGDNPRFFKLLTAFEKRTGLPVLLNTSFNRRGEPLVESPADAVACFLDTGLDFLVLGDVLVTKHGERSAFGRFR